MSIDRSLPLAPDRAARLLMLAAMRAGAFDPDQPRDEQGRWTSGVGFAADAWDRYPNAPDTRAYSELETRRVISEMKRRGKLNADGTVTLYHATLSDPEEIESRGLIPAFEKAPGQDWKAVHSDYATYFHLDKDVAERDIEFGGSIVEARIPITRQTLSRFVPDEDTSSDVNEGVNILVRGGGAIAFIGGVPASAVRVIQTSKFEGAAFNPDQPRDESGKWTSGGGDSGHPSEGQVSQSGLDKRFPAAGRVVDGRTIPDFDDEFGPDVPNVSSIKASLYDYEVLDGIREVKMSEFGDDKPSFYSVTEEARVKELAEAIKESGKITPLIVVVDADKRGPYVLEGGHRFDALKLIGAKSFPALVVVDTEELTLRAGARRSETALHRAADAHVAKLSVAVRYAFARGRKALGRSAPDAARAARAVRAALEDVLPGTLSAVLEAGGVVGAEVVKRLRVAEFDPNQPRDEDGKWTAGGFVINQKVYHGGVSEHSAEVTYFTTNKDMAQSYVEMSNDRFGSGGSLHEAKITIAKPAPEAVIKREAERFGIDNELYTPASVFDAELHGKTEVKQLVERLKELGYDGAVLEDIAYGKQITDKAYVKFRTAAFDPDQPRDEYGRWTDIGAGSPFVNTPEFKTWFGDSKVVDKEGKPLVVHHSGSFDETEGAEPIIGPEGMHFGTLDASLERDSKKLVDDLISGIVVEEDEGRWHWSMPDGSESYDVEEEGYDSREEAQEAGERDAVSREFSDFEYAPVTSVYLSIRNPFRVSDGEKKNWAIDVAKAKAAGYDGLVYRNLYEDKGSTSWVVFEASQIKSIKNTGTFDPKSKLVTGGSRRSETALHRAAEPKRVGPIRLRFDRANPRAVKWAREHAAKLAKDLSETTEQNVRDAVARAVEAGDLDALRDDILAAVGDEARAELIARTEVMTAAHEGQREAWRQAVEEGLLTGEEKRTWIVTLDDKLCPICEALDGATTDLDGAYPGDGGDGPPAHPRCRCTEGIAS